MFLAADKSPLDGPAMTMAKNLALAKKAVMSKSMFTANQNHQSVLNNVMFKSSSILKVSIHIKSNFHK